MTEKIPEGWKKSTLVQLYKGKGNKNDLDNMRHIHIKSEVPKLFSQIVTNVAKENLFDNMSKFQIATKPGHRATEHVYVIMSLISLYERNKKALIICLYDLKKFFDRENLHDCMSELYKSNVKGKIYKLLYAMNENIKIKVKTPVGLSEEEETGPGVGQGTVEGAICSSVNIDNGVVDQFHDENDIKEELKAITYEGITIHPLLFQDDVLNATDSIESANFGNKRMEILLESKLLDFNLDKSCYIIAGNKEAINRMKVKLKSNPINLCDQPMKEVHEEKYLGSILAASVNESIAATVARRIGIATRNIYEIRAIIEDSRANTVGGITVAFKLWNSWVLPMLLYCCEMWSQIPKRTLKKLEDLTNKFLKVILNVGRNGCPIPCLYWMTGMMFPINEILYRKMLFLHHLATLPESSLANEVYKIQSQQKLSNCMVSECLDVLSEWNIKENNIIHYSKKDWRELMKEKIYHRNRLQLLEKIKGYKKLIMMIAKMNHMK